MKKGYVEIVVGVAVICFCVALMIGTVVVMGHFIIKYW